MFYRKNRKIYLGTVLVESPEEKNRDSKFQIVTCSNIIPLKRVIRLAEVLAMFEKNEQEVARNLKWTCFGSGIQKEELESFCKENLRLIEVEMKGWQENRSVLEFYQKNKVDLFINLSTTEGLPVSIMEAMSYAIPVIATDVGGTSEIVEDTYNGYLLKQEFSNSELYDLIRKMFFMNIEKRDKLCKNAFKKWNSNFQAKRIIESFLKRLKEYGVRERGEDR